MVGQEVRKVRNLYSNNIILHIQPLPSSTWLSTAAGAGPYTSKNMMGQLAFFLHFLLSKVMSLGGEGN